MVINWVVPEKLRTAKRAKMVTSLRSHKMHEEESKFLSALK